MYGVWSVCCRQHVGSPLCQLVMLQGGGFLKFRMATKPNHLLAKLKACGVAFTRAVLW